MMHVHDEYAVSQTGLLVDWMIVKDIEGYADILI
jgi:hypothetical protein